MGINLSWSVDFNTFFKSLKHVFVIVILISFNGVKAEEYVANHLERDFFKFGERCGKDELSKLTTTEGILRAWLLPIDLKNPIGDAKKRILIKDYRLLLLPGAGYMLDKTVSPDLLCILSTRRIEVSDNLDIDTLIDENSDSLFLLLDQVKIYVTQYNQYILKYYFENQERLDSSLLTFCESFEELCAGEALTFCEYFEGVCTGEVEEFNFELYKKRNEKNKRGR